MTEELNECELGTREYWDKRYEEEIRNYNSHGDVGDIWFGEDIADRIVKWMEKNTSKQATIADVGCGNGMLLVYLAQSGFEDLSGFDYSECAIHLAEQVMKKNNYYFKLVQCDILKSHGLCSNFDVIVDKGTYDAISLMKDAKKNRTVYIENMYECLKNHGFLLLTSCNWTKEELEEQFLSKFTVHCVIPTPQFKFGGKVGSIVSVVVFKKKHA
ncbi:EEF1A lysine methyltransferase 2 [Agrilus planipennis]|uniref:Protein-lysine N-methyltransferase LOC108737380 n=1 Tax=Agrilus planipennis TaxID=224129 RepID=A0A1W4WP53_AGRPL|nr:EEF1A lysine methyltransferase 2 [Agrilus planipennis]